MLGNRRCSACARQASKLSGPIILQASPQRIGHLADLILARWPVFLPVQAGKGDGDQAG